MLQKQSWKALVALVVVALFGLMTPEAQARGGVAQVPVQVGVGPAGVMLGGPTYEPELGFGSRLMDDQALHTGLRINIAAVISGDLVRRHPGMVPNNYRRQIIQSGEVRYSPGIVSLIPSSLYISPPILGDSQAYGATWSLLGVGLVPVLRPVRFSLNAALIGTLMYINSPTLAAEHYVFARPGAELRFDLEVPLAEEFLISIGFATQVYLPQTLDGTGVEMLGGGDFLSRNSLWNINQFYIQGHFRVPYSHRY